MRVEDGIERMQDRYLRQLADRRSNRIFIALRRYRNRNGRWPQTLDDIQNLVPTEILVDPINGGSFVYKLTEENFTLYSKGKNNIDEGGKRGGDSDDWPIWSQSMYKPPLPFPPQQNRRRKTKKEKANAEQQ